MTTEIKKIRDGNQSFDLKIPDDLLEIYADGVSLAQLGVPFSKIVFHTVDSIDDPISGAVEQRKAAFRLVITSDILLQFCRNVLIAHATNPDAAKTAISDYAKNFSSQIDTIVAQAGKN